MKALLIQPPIEDFYNTPHRVAAMGLVSLIPILTSQGWECNILNYPVKNKGRAKELPRELEYLKDHLIQGEGGPASWFTGWRRWGPEVSEIIKEVKKTSPDLILISCFAWAYSDHSLSLIQAIKKEYPKGLIASGGAGATIFPELFKQAGADWVVTGEGELGLMALLNKINTNQPTNEIAYIIASTPKNEIEPIISEIPRASGRRRLFSMSISRGCPRGCLFCSNRLCHGEEFRIASIDKITGAIKQKILTEHNLTHDIHINFEDDNLLLKRSYFLELLGEIQKTIGKTHHFTFTAENGLDYTLLSPDIVSHLASLGLTQLNLSLASLDPDRAREQERFLKKDHYREVLQRAGELNLPVITYFIAGLPGDTPRSMVATLVELHKELTTTGVSLFYPVPGLSGIPEKEHFRTISPKLCLGSAAYPWGGGLTTDQLITIFRLSRFSNLIKSGTHQELVEKISKSKRLHTLIKHYGDWKIIEVPRQDIPMVESFCKKIKT